MGLGFLKKKKYEEISLEEAALRVSNRIEAAEKDLEVFVSKKHPELKDAIENLTHLLENFNFRELHPRLKNPAQNFVSVMLNLWKDIDDESSATIFDETSRRLEKVAIMKVKRFRILFGSSHPEVEQVDQCLRDIAGIIGVVEAKKKELKLDDLKATLGMIERLKELVKEKEAIAKKSEEIISEIEILNSEGENGESGEEVDEVLSSLRRKEDQISAEIRKREADLQRKIAYARKPLKMYAHMVGSRINLDSHHFLEEVRIESLASGAASEIMKGNIKLKEKKLDAVIDSLNEIASGKLRKDLEKIKELKKELVAIRGEMKKIRTVENSNQTTKRQKALRKKLMSMDEMRGEVEREMVGLKEVLEDRLSELFGGSVKLSI